jgi:hypothetical protein
MYDAVTAANLPGTPDGLVSCYIDGDYENIVAVRNRFPAARLVRIAVHAATLGADVYDVETGDITASQVPAILERERRRGRNPTVYCGDSMWAGVAAIVRGAGLAEPPYWIAQWDGNPDIPPGAVAKQYLSTNAYDTSAVAAHWPGIDPAPANPTPAPATAPEDTMLIAAVDRLTVPKGTDWPGDFLLGSNGQVRHITTTADLKAFQDAGLKSITISYSQYLVLTAA